eukprot:9482407-Pyramimonas_sp.AAC.1
MNRKRLLRGGRSGGKSASRLQEAIIALIVGVTLLRLYSYSPGVPVPDLSDKETSLQADKTEIDERINISGGLSSRQRERKRHSSISIPANHDKHARQAPEQRDQTYGELAKQRNQLLANKRYVNKYNQKTRSLPTIAQRTPVHDCSGTSVSVIRTRRGQHNQGGGATPRAKITPPAELGDEPEEREPAERTRQSDHARAVARVDGSIDDVFPHLETTSKVPSPSPPIRCFTQAPPSHPRVYPPVSRPNHTPPTPIRPFVRLSGSNTH